MQSARLLAILICATSATALRITSTVAAPRVTTDSTMTATLSAPALGKNRVVAPAFTTPRRSAALPKPAVCSAPLVDATFYLEIGAIVAAAATAGLFALHAGWSFYALPPLESLGSVAAAAAPDPLQQCLALAASFELFAHVRALWHMPLWTERYNIFIDASLGALGVFCSGTPSAAALLYFVMHAGFLLMKLGDERRFRGLFLVRSLAEDDDVGRYGLGSHERRLLRGLYSIATLFELSVQSMFVLNSLSLTPLVGAAVLYVACCSLEKPMHLGADLLSTEKARA